MNFIRLGCSLLWFYSSSLSIALFLVFGVVRANHLYASAKFSNSKFSLKSTYNILMPTLNPYPNRTWKFIWKLKLPPKIL